MEYVIAFSWCCCCSLNWNWVRQSFHGYHATRLTTLKIHSKQNPWCLGQSGQQHHRLGEKKKEISEGTSPCAHCQPLNYWEGIPRKRASSQGSEWQHCLQKNQFCVVKAQSLCSGGLPSLKPKNQMKLQNFISALNCHKSYLCYERKQNVLNGQSVCWCALKILPLWVQGKSLPYLQKGFGFLLFSLLKVPPVLQKRVSHAATCGIIFMKTWIDWKMGPLYFKGTGNTSRKKKRGIKNTHYKYNKWYTRNTHKKEIGESDSPWNVNCVQIYSEKWTDVFEISGNYCTKPLLGA